MRNLISFMHISLDGFVAGPRGEMNWIQINDEIFAHVEQRIGKTDTALYGRITYTMMENYWPTAADKPNASRHDIAHSRWYKTAGKIVLSTTLKTPESANTRVIAADLAATIRAIKNEEGSEILVFGSPTATHSLLREGLIDGFWLFVNPIILGQGIPLFTGSGESIKLKRISTHAFDCGVTELNYLTENR